MHAAVYSSSRFLVPVSTHRAHRPSCCQVASLLARSQSPPLRVRIMPGATQFDVTGLHDEHALRATCPDSLSDLCVSVIAANFNNRPTLRGIPTRYINRVTELLPTTLPLEVTAPLIDDEGYWKRCALTRWECCQISDHGSSWKRLYFERNLADFLEAFDPHKTDTEELMRTLGISKDYIFSLRLKQFLSHLDMEMVFQVRVAMSSMPSPGLLTWMNVTPKCLCGALFLFHLDKCVTKVPLRRTLSCLLQNVPTLCNLDMTYGVKQIGMDYERSLFGMKLHDVRSLANALKVNDPAQIWFCPDRLLWQPVMHLASPMLSQPLSLCHSLSPYTRSPPLGHGDTHHPFAPMQPTR